MDVTIEPMATDADAAAFRTLNEEWVSRFFVLEAEDCRQLGDPVAAYIAPGGEILMAKSGDEAVGCVAIVPDGTGAWELSKMAVSPDLRGQGVGRQILAAAIDRARELGATSLFLGSSRKLANAVHLYESLGFEHVDPGSIHMPYARADVFMKLELVSVPAPSVAPSSSSSSGP